VHDLTPSPSGNWGCPADGDFYTTLGCIALNVTTQTICETMPGYRWQNAFTNKQGKMTGGSEGEREKKPSRKSKKHREESDFYTTLGCIALNVTTETVCETMPGFRWQNDLRIYKVHKEKRREGGEEEKQKRKKK
jgi:hypothetical protein